MAMHVRDRPTIDYAIATQSAWTLSPAAVGHLANLLLLVTAVPICFYYVREEPFYLGPPQAEDVAVLWVAPALLSLLALAAVTRGAIHVMRGPHSAGNRWAAVLLLALPHVVVQYAATRYPLYASYMICALALPAEQRTFGAAAMRGAHDSSTKRIRVR